MKRESGEIPGQSPLLWNSMEVQNIVKPLTSCWEGILNWSQSEDLPYSVVILIIESDSSYILVG